MNSMGIDVVVDKRGNKLYHEIAREVIENMQKILKLSEINFETNLKVDDVIKIADVYIKEKGETYEIDKKNILYDPKSYVTKEPVWYVDVISIKVKEKWPEAYDSLAISDREGRLVYVKNDHGVVVEKF